MNFNNLPLSQYEFCRMCNIPVDNKNQHLKMIHGWEKCKFCHNQMVAHALIDHVKRRHRQILKRKHDDYKAEIRNERDVTDEPKTPPNEPDDGTKKLRLANPPPVQMIELIQNVVEHNELVLDNVPETPLAAKKEKLYPNMVFVSDKRLNEFLAGGRIGCENGQLFLRDL